MTELIRVAKKKQADPKKLAVELAETGRAFHGRGWALGTSGNYSAVLRAQMPMAPPERPPRRASTSQCLR